MDDHASSSYPFLSITRHHGVSYGDVLSYADFLRKCDAHKSCHYWHRRAVYSLPGVVKDDIYALVHGLARGGQ